MSSLCEITHVQILANILMKKVFLLLENDNIIHQNYMLFLTFNKFLYLV